MTADGYTPGEIIVRFVFGTTEDQARELIDENGFIMREWFGTVLTTAYIKGVPHGEEEEACESLNESDLVEIAEQVPRREFTTTSE